MQYTYSLTGKGIYSFNKLNESYKTISLVDKFCHKNFKCNKNHSIYCNIDLLSSSLNSGRFLLTFILRRWATTTSKEICKYLTDLWHLKIVLRHKLQLLKETWVGGPYKFPNVKYFFCRFTWFWVLAMLRCISCISRCVSGSPIIFGSTVIRSSGNTIIITIGFINKSVIFHSSLFWKYLIFSFVSNRKGYGFWKLAWIDN